MAAILLVFLAIPSCKSRAKSETESEVPSAKGVWVNPAAGEIAAEQAQFRREHPRSRVPDLIGRQGARGSIPQLAALLKTGSPLDQIDAVEVFVRCFQKQRNLRK